jgi:hypothetical protein
MFTIIYFENEVHFLLECNSYSTLRDDFTNSISSIVPNYLKLYNNQKFIYMYLMTCEDKNILRLTSQCVSEQSKGNNSKETKTNPYLLR